MLTLLLLLPADRAEFTVRASVVDPGAGEDPAAGFVLGTDEKPEDRQYASVDVDVAPRGRLVIWLMSPNKALFERLNSYGLHAIQPHYPRQWFGKICREQPVDETCRGDARLEATTGVDASEELHIDRRDCAAGRAERFLAWLVREHPEGDWGQFLDEQGGLRYDKVILSGASHGATSAARWAKAQRVARVVCLCGPRDQFQSWQSLPSATPADRYFGFSHTLDQGWVEDHYCRSWELMGLHEFGPVINVDRVKPPFRNTRRLITSFDVGGDAKRAHGAVQPGSRAKKLKNGELAHEAVWRYLYTHPVDVAGRPVPQDENCDKDQRD